MEEKKEREVVYYFDQNVEHAIIQYNNTEDQLERNKIFQRHIYKALDKLAENIIHTFKFYYFEVPSDVVKKEVVSFLVLKLNLYDQTKGKAFSYFSTIAKNYLIYFNNRNYKEYKLFQSFQQLSEAQCNMILGSIYQNKHSHNLDEIKEDYKNIICILKEEINNQSNYLFKRQRDKKIAEIILDTLLNYEQFDDYHKKTIYNHIKQVSNQPTKYVTNVLKKIKIQYFRIKKRYYKNKKTIDLLLQ